MSTIAAMTARTTTNAVFKTMCINAPIMPQTPKSRTRRKEATAEINAEGPPVAGKRRAGALVPLLFGLACDRRRRRVLDLQPTYDATGPIRRPKAL
jgi:hypothetical protein